MNRMDSVPTEQIATSTLTTNGKHARNLGSETVTIDPPRSNSNSPFLTPKHESSDVVKLRHNLNELEINIPRKDDKARGHQKPVQDSKSRKNLKKLKESNDNAINYFQFLPPEMICVILTEVELELKTLSIFRVCKQFAVHANNENIWKRWCLRKWASSPYYASFPNPFLPPNRDYKWFAKCLVVNRELHMEATIGHAPFNRAEIQMFGEWSGGEPNGQLIAIHSNGHVYVGEYKGGYRNGKGTYIWPGGDRYEGEWNQDLMHGRGVYYWKDGAYYTGDWAKDERNGKGVFVSINDGHKYVGDWDHDVMHGSGIYLMPGNKRYEGEFKDFRMHGRGVYKLANGTEYEGEFRDDKMLGKGTIRVTDGGGVYEGEWVNETGIPENEDEFEQFRLRYWKTTQVITAPTEQSSSATTSTTAIPEVRESA